MKRALLLNGSVDYQQEISKISSTTRKTTAAVAANNRNMRIKRESPCLGLRFMPIKLGNLTNILSLKKNTSANYAMSFVVSDRINST